MHSINVSNYFFIIRRQVGLLILNPRIRQIYHSDHERSGESHDSPVEEPFLQATTRGGVEWVGDVLPCRLILNRKFRLRQ